MTAVSKEDEKEDELVIFAKNVHQLRLHYGLNQKQMAKLCHVGLLTIRMLDRGICPQGLGCNILLYIQKEFGIRPCDMFLPLFPEDDSKANGK